MSLRTPPSLRILLIDDDPAVHTDLKKAFASASKPVAPVNSATTPLSVPDIHSALQAQEAVALLQKALAAGNPYQVAFVDMHMSDGWNGPEIMNQLWAVQPDLQIALCAASSDYTRKDLAGLLGINENFAILRKPIDPLEALQLAINLAHKSASIPTDTTESASPQPQILATKAELSHEMSERSKAEERFRATFETAPVPMCVINVKTVTWVDANEAFVTLSGWPRADLMNQRVEVGSFWRAQPDCLRKQLASPDEVLRAESRFYDRRREEHFIQFSRRFIHVKDEPHVLLVLHDVTAQRLNEEKNRQTAQLEAVGRLAAGVAHDFNNILTVIKGQASLLVGDSNLPPSAQQSIEQMADAADRATGLVRQLLAFGRQQVVVPRPIDVRSHIESQSRLLGRLVGERVALRWESQPSMPAAQVDPGSLDQVLLNLVVNARDAMPQGGCITVSACTARIDESHCERVRDAKPGDYILVKVADTGTGIAPAIQARVFEPYFTTKEASGGTGLGLATVHGLVKQQGGWLELESTPGFGTTFFVYLPRTTEEAEPARLATQPLQPSDWNVGAGRAVLIIEDEDINRSVLRQMLKRFGFDVLEAGDSLQALDLWRQHMKEIQLVISDVGIPGNINGIGVGERIAADRPQTKIIYCTGYSAETLGIDNGFKEGHNFLAKPYDAQSLLQILNRLFPKASTSRPISVGLARKQPVTADQLIREMNMARTLREPGLQPTPRTRSQVASDGSTDNGMLS
ncbi:MAG: response regulator [Verrucomicrobiaceae bacterium]|nr:response regulator [Verrucomicrobiaceae bacterium]